MRVRRADQNDIPELTHLAMDSFDRTDIMVKMGRDYLSTVFFPSVISDDTAGVMLAEEDGRLLGFSMYFKDLEKFNSDVKMRHLVKNILLVLVRTATGVLTVNDLLNVAFGHRKVFDLVRGVPHYGPVAVSPDVKGSPQGGTTILWITRAVLKELKEMGDACWGIATASNTQSWRLMEAMRFKRVAEIPLFGRTDYLYRYEFDPDGR